jgi:hypothetical protein
LPLAQLLRQVLGLLNAALIQLAVRLVGIAHLQLYSTRSASARPRMLHQCSKCTLSSSIHKLTLLRPASSSRARSRMIFVDSIMALR